MKHLKPPACTSCSMEHESQYWVPDETVEGAEVFILGQNPGAEEVKQGRPFCGKTGETMESVFLPLAGLERGRNVSLGNLLRCRLGNSNEMPRGAKLLQAANHCNRAYLRPPAATKLIVAQGAYSWGWLQERRKGMSIDAWRGHLGPFGLARESLSPVDRVTSPTAIPVYGILHIADLFPNRHPRMTLPSKQDWRKIPAILAGTHPRPLPPRQVVGENHWTIVQDWFREAHKKAPYICWDTEFIFEEDNPYNPDNYEITMVSAGYPGMTGGIQLQWIGGVADSWEKSEFVTLFHQLLLDKSSLFHNAKAEMRSTYKTWGWNPAMFKDRFHDTMLWHAVCYSEWPHSLEFLESLYSPYAKVKHLPTTDLLRNWGDTCVTIDVWERMKREQTSDPGSWKVYTEQSLKLVLPILERELKGIMVNRSRVAPAIEEYNVKIDYAQRLAQAAAGWPINLNSPAQLSFWLYQMSKYAVMKSKHTKRPTVNKDAIAQLRQSRSPFDAEWEAENGVDIPYITQRIAENADPLLEAIVLSGEAEQVMGHYLRPLIINETA